MTLEEGEFKLAIDGCIDSALFSAHLVLFEVNALNLGLWRECVKFRNGL